MSMKQRQMEVQLSSPSEVQSPKRIERNFMRFTKVYITSDLSLNQRQRTNSCVLNYCGSEFF